MHAESLVHNIESRLISLQVHTLNLMLRYIFEYMFQKHFQFYLIKHRIADSFQLIVVVFHQIYINDREQISNNSSH